MSEPIRRRRRRRITDSSQSDVLPSEPTATETSSTKTSSDDSSSNIPQPLDHEATHQLTIDRIRSEIQEDEYHCLFDEPDFSDDTHDWGDNEESVSSDYWHFLGSYE